MPSADVIFYNMRFDFLFTPYNLHKARVCNDRLRCVAGNLGLVLVIQTAT